MKVTPCTFCQVSCWFGENKERCPKYNSEAKPAPVQSDDKGCDCESCRAIEGLNIEGLRCAVKQSPVQSAEDLAKKITGKGYDSCGQRIDLFCQDVVSLLESFAAAQRQAGREEADDRAFKMLEAFGVPRGRAETVENGIMVLQDRMRKAIESEQMASESLSKRYAALLEAAIDAERFMTVKGVSHECPVMINLRKPLRELDEKEAPHATD